MQAVEQNRPVDFEEDAFSIFQHCQAFYNQTLTYQRDFTEQRSSEHTSSQQTRGTVQQQHTVHDYN
jgi:hypothetical protein